MTREEAIQIIKNLPAYRAELIWGGNSDLAKALGMAIEDMEKQIPKKPIETKGDTFAINKDGKECYFMLCDCPSCKKRLKAYQLHCECGQAINWED